MGKLEGLRGGGAMAAAVEKKAAAVAALHGDGLSELRGGIRKRMAGNAW